MSYSHRIADLQLAERLEAPFDFFFENRYDGLIMITDGYAPKPSFLKRFHGDTLWMIYNEDAFGGEYPIGEAKKYVAELTAQEKENRKKIILECNPAALIDKNAQRCYNGGYLFLQKVYHELGLDKICRKIEKRHRNKYDLDEILQMLLFTRILYPGGHIQA